MKEKSRLRTPDKIRSDSKATRIKAWNEYHELKKTMPDDQAIATALRKADPSKDDPYYSQFHPSKPRELLVWQKHGLWPPPELKEHGKEGTPLTMSDTLEMTQEEIQEALQYSRKPQTPDDKPPTSDSDRQRITYGLTSQIEPAIGSLDDVKHRKAVLPEIELLLKVKEMLNNIEVAERPTTAKGRKSSLETGMIAARFPKTLIEELEALPGRKSHHLEKALTLYLRALKSEE